jgi:hypothetical protein
VRSAWLVACCTDRLNSRTHARASADRVHQEEVAELQEQRSGGSSSTQNTVSGATIFGVVVLVGLLLGAVGVAIKLRLRGGGGGGDGGGGAGCGGSMGNLCFRTQGRGGNGSSSATFYNQHYSGGNATCEEAVTLAMVSSPSAASGSAGVDGRSMEDREDLRPTPAPKPSAAFVGKVATAGAGGRAPPARRAPPRSAPPPRAAAARSPPTAAPPAHKPPLATKPKLQLHLAAVPQPSRSPHEEAAPTNIREDGGVGVVGCQSWVKLQSETGEPYYWNERTDVTQWVAPSPDHAKRRGSSSAV